MVESPPRRRPARGPEVRIVVSRESNSAPASPAALRHRYDELTSAGAEVWEVPGTVVHAKVVVADDVVSPSARSTSTRGRSTATRRS